MAEERPTPPESVPKYLSEGLPKQDTPTLTDIIDYAEALIEHRNRPVTDDIPDDATITGEETARGVIVEEYVTCGDETCHCSKPGATGHGPYKYRYYRDADGTVVSEYAENE